MRRPSPASLVSLVTVGGMVAFTLWQLHPSLLLSDTTTAGGDTGAHVAIPAYMRSHLLAHGRLTGWSPEWFDGYPSLTFYFPLPSLLISLGSFLIPYNIAFKLVTVLGLVSLPVAAWAFGRLSRMASPAPACLAIATLPFLFDRTYQIDGGNIASTLAGEFAFSISLSIALVFLGVVARGLTTGRQRALAALLLALCLLCHLIPALFAGVGAMILTLMRLDRRRAWWLVSMGATGVAVTGFWLVPLILRSAYTSNMGYEKVSNYVQSLFPPSQHWVLGLAVVGLVLSLVRRRPMGLFLAIMAAGSALAFCIDPQGKLYNARILPFWVLCLYLMAGFGASEIGVLLAERWRWLDGKMGASPRLGWTAIPQPAQGNPGPGAISTPLLAGVLAVIFVALPLVTLPSWLSWARMQSSFIPDWVQWNYTGYEGKAAYPEYRGLITTMSRVGAQHGCGRAMWEYEPEENQLGTPEALMLLPYWTHLCINSMEGLLFESSATTPYHFLNQAQLSATPSEPMRNLPYRPLDVPAGVAKLQLLGVRYYMAVSSQAKEQAATDPVLHLIATSGPWPVTVNNRQQEQTWNIYQVGGSAEVSSLANQPVVIRGGASSAQTWLHDSVAWYNAPQRQAVFLAASGPAQWARVSANDASPPRRPLPPVTVSHIVHTDDSVSFQVDKTGTPVLVKTSYFPNWQASGANGPFRVTPNLMVVIPTSHHVRLHFGYTGVDVVGWALSLVGLAMVVVLARRKPLAFKQRAPAHRRGQPAPPEETPSVVAAGVGGPSVIRPPPETLDWPGL